MIELLSGEMVYVWEARGQIDQNEGRGGTRSLGFFHTEEEAKEAAKDQGVMGTPGEVRAVQALKSKGWPEGTFHFYLVSKIELEDKETIRKRALDKLTLAERKALGL